jgi:hypothetical protein
MTSTHGQPLRLTRKQYDWLLHEINANRIRQLDGNSHLEAWDVRRTLTQIFGFGGWELRVKDLRLAWTHITPAGTEKRAKGGGTYLTNREQYTAVYTCVASLTVHGLDGTSATFEGSAAGAGNNLPLMGDAHDMAMKTAESQALKRCAINLGDQFGLSLYNDGNTAPVVRGTFVPPDEDGEQVTPPPADEQPIGGELGDRAQDDEVDEYVHDLGPSGGLGDDMRDADTHPLPPLRDPKEREHHRARRDAVKQQEPVRKEDPFATIDVTEEGRKALAAALGAALPGELHPLRADVYRRHDIGVQTITAALLDELAPGSAGQLDIASGGSFPLIQVIDRIGLWVKEHGRALAQPQTTGGQG